MKATDSIWKACRGEEQMVPVSGALFRMVKKLEQIATWQIVENLDEQAELEDLIEEKISAVSNLPKEDELHILLKAPFRYPPLQWGSRFGRTHEPSIFYGGCSVDATLAELAYYRFVYLMDIDTQFEESLQSQHTMFSIGYQSEKGIRLQDPPFDQHHDLIAHPSNYSHAQQLGAEMRVAEVEVFEYPSSRAADHAPCVGIFTPGNFTQNYPLSQEEWLSELTADTVTFKSMGSRIVKTYSISDFFHNGEFPKPA